MNISAFRSLYRRGFASAARYSVQYGETELYPESITLPSKSVSVFTHSLFGPIVQYPYRETFNDNVVMTFPEDSLGKMRNFWESKMNGAGGGAAFPHRIDTQNANLHISQLSGSDTPVATYDVYGAYPVSIVPVNQGYGMMNETTKVQVMIKYYMYEYHQTGNAGMQPASSGRTPAVLPTSGVGTYRDLLVDVHQAMGFG